MAKAKGRGGKKRAARAGKKPARSKPAAKRKATRPGPPVARTVVVPGAWPFPMPLKS